MSLDVLLRPEKIAIVGDAREKTTYKMFIKIVERTTGFPKVKIVDLGGEINGAEKSVKYLGRDIDICVVVLGGKSLGKHLQEIFKRCKLVVLLSDISEQILENREKILGPRSAGIINNDVGLRTSISEIPPAGSVSLISQKQAVTVRILRKMSAYSVGVSKVICTGEGQGIPEIDILKVLASDKSTSTICLNIYRTKNLRNLLDEIGHVSRSKPVVFHFLGKDDWMVASAVRQRGGIYVRNVRELVCGAKILSETPPLLGDRIFLLARTVDLCLDAAKHLSEFTICDVPEKILVKAGLERGNTGCCFKNIDLLVRYIPELEKVSDGIFLVLEEDEEIEKLEGIRVNKTFVVIYPRRIRSARFPIFEDVEDAALAMKISAERGKFLRKSKIC
ncbi:MAG: hypothetical protein QXF11_01775 [Candidatus Hadarchaeales archaeon]